MRTFGIWLFGLLASALIAGALGSALDGPYSSDKSFWLAIGGMFAFSCFRLWAAAEWKR